MVPNRLFDFPNPNQPLLATSLCCGLARTGESVGDVSDTPTISASSPKVTRADFFFFAIDGKPCSDAIELLSEASLGVALVLCQAPGRVASIVESCCDGK